MGDEFKEVAAAIKMAVMRQLVLNSSHMSDARGVELLFDKYAPTVGYDLKQRDFHVEVSLGKGENIITITVGESSVNSAPARHVIGSFCSGVRHGNQIYYPTEFSYWANRLKLRRNSTSFRYESFDGSGHRFKAATLDDLINGIDSGLSDGNKVRDCLTGEQSARLDGLLR